MSPLMGVKMKEEEMGKEQDVNKEIKLFRKIRRGEKGVYDDR